MKKARNPTPVQPLEPTLLCRHCDAAAFTFQTTEELEDLTEMPGQDRAFDAVRFGTGIRRQGYNLYALGPAGIGKHSFVRRFLDEKRVREPTPDDWCYVNRFEAPQRPQALRLPAGQGRQLQHDMEQLVEELRSAIPAVFESDEYRARAQEIEDAFEERHEHAFKELQEQAESREITLLRTPGGFAFAPTRKGEVISPQEYEKLPADEQQRIEAVVANLQERLQKLINEVPKWRRETRERQKALNREVTLYAVGHLIEELKQRYPQLPQVQEYLDAVQQDVIDNAAEFRRSEEGTQAPVGLTGSHEPAFQRYRVNVIVENEEGAGAPVIYEDHPMFQNLVGRVEHIAQMGALLTDFTLIKPGALHRANGGYLLLDAHQVLINLYAWEGLKRALKAREIRLESLGQLLSLVSTVSLEPDPIPLDVKVVLLGDRLLYYLLYQYDPEFSELFKVAADFEEQMERNPDNDMVYARLIAGLVRQEKLLALNRDAVARTIEFSARVSEDAERLSTHMATVVDILREADHLAREVGHTVVEREDLQAAIDARERRISRIRERIEEEILRETVLIDTDGECVGQVNGLSIIDLGNYSFGQPSRITATARLGEGQVVDIEREVELGGSIHSKGVLILSSFISAHYATDCPFSLSSSLVFEQSYGGVEGDSASVAELCALLSVLAQAPVRQALAVTGSINQRGQVQAIGGVNEKIEGFFDICKARGLNGRQGVLIPRANVKHLMLRREIVEAAETGRFRIYPLDTVDDAIQLLTGLPAGTRDGHGEYPPDSVNGRVEARLVELAQLRQAYGEAAKSKSGKRGKKDR